MHRIIDFGGEGLRASCRRIDSGSDLAGRFSCAVVGFGIPASFPGFRFLVGEVARQAWSEVNCGLRKMRTQVLRRAGFEITQRWLFLSGSVDMSIQWIIDRWGFDIMEVGPGWRVASVRALTGV